MNIEKYQEDIDGIKLLVSELQSNPTKETCNQQLILADEMIKKINSMSEKKLLKYSKENNIPPEEFVCKLTFLWQSYKTEIQKLI